MEIRQVFYAHVFSSLFQYPHTVPPIIFIMNVMEKTDRSYEELQ